MMVFNSRGSSGNIFAVLGSAINELRKEGRASDCGELREKVFACGSYEDALGVIGEYVPLFDKGTGKVYGGC